MKKLNLLGLISLAFFSENLYAGAICQNICRNSSNPAACERVCCDGASSTPGCRKSARNEKAPFELIEASASQDREIEKH